MIVPQEPIQQRARRDLRYRSTTPERSGNQTYRQGFSHVRNEGWGDIIGKSVLTDDRKHLPLKFGIQESASSQERPRPCRLELDHNRHEVRQVVGDFPVVGNIETKRFG